MLILQARTNCANVFWHGSIRDVFSMLLTLDDVAYTTKPDRMEFARIMNRMKTAKPREVDKRELLAHIAAGKTFIGGTFENELQTLTSWQLAALDFDNDTTVLDANGKPLKDENGNTVKRFLQPGEDGYITPLEALERCESLRIAPMVMYQSFNCSIENPRFRIVFDMGEGITEVDTAEAVMLNLHDAFPECDHKCTNLNRMYCGTDKAVWAICEAWFI